MKIDAKQKVGFEGIYRIILQDQYGGVRKFYEFPNLILNNGLNGIGTNGTSWVTIIALGTGTGVPQATDTSLSGTVVTSTTSSSSSSGHVSTGDPYNWIIYRRRFGQGVATGNWTEVGIGRTSTNLWSRALILDSLGVPTTLTVIATDIVTIEYELRVYPKITDTTGTISISGVNYGYIVRPAAFGSYGSHVVDLYVSGNLMGSNSSSIIYYSGGIGTYTAYPSGTASTLSGSPTVLSYSSGSYTKKMKWDAPISIGNVGGVRSVNYNIGTSNTVAYQCQFDPVIPKTDQKTLSLTFGLTWARRT